MITVIQYTLCSVYHQLNVFYYNRLFIFIILFISIPRWLALYCHCCTSETLQANETISKFWTQTVQLQSYIGVFHVHYMDIYIFIFMYTYISEFNSVGDWKLKFLETAGINYMVRRHVLITMEDWFISLVWQPN